MGITVIQVFKLFGNFEKPDYNHNIRSDVMTWPEDLRSSTGFFEDEILYLPATLEPDWIEDLVGLVILQDVVDLDRKKIEACDIPYKFKGFNPDVLLARNPENYVFNQPLSSGTFELFHFVKDGEEFNLHFNSQALSTTSSLKGREDHKIAKLRSGKPVRYAVNTKNDFSLTGRRQRSYQEYEYIIELAGIAREMKFIEGLAVTKKIPKDLHKDINERKLLY